MASPARSTASTGRRAAVWALIAVASVIGLVSITASWVNQQALDEGSWRETSEQMLQDPEIRGAVSAFLVDELYANVDLAAELEAQLPARADVLAGPITAALREPMTDAVGRLLERPRVQGLFITAVAAAHDRLILVIDDDLPAGVSSADGNVTVNLSEMVASVGAQLGVPTAALDRLPPDAGTFTVLQSDELGTLQTVVKAIRALDVWLAVVVVALFALAIFLARGHRRETLRTIGWAFIVVGLLVLVVRRAAGTNLVDTLASPAGRDAAENVWEIATGVLRDIGRAIVLYGIVIVLGAALAGPTVVAMAVRRWMAPTLNTRPAMTWGIAFAAYLLLVLWAPTNELSDPLWILILGGILAVGVQALRRMTLRELPDAGYTGATAATLRRAGRGVAGAFTRTTKPVPAVAAGPPRSAAGEIEHLGELRDAGLITAEEFDRGKKLTLA